MELAFALPDRLTTCGFRHSMFLQSSLHYHPVAFVTCVFNSGDVVQGRFCFQLFFFLVLFRHWPFLILSAILCSLFIFAQSCVCLAVVVLSVLLTPAGKQCSVHLLVVFHVLGYLHLVIGA